MPTSTVPERIALASTANVRGGVWRHVEDLGVGLRRAGIEVTVGLLPGATVLQRACDHAELPWAPLHQTLGRQIDLWHLHLHDTYDRRAFLALAGRRLRGRSVVTEHLPHSNASDARLELQDPRTPYARQAKSAFKRLEFGLTDEVIAVSASTTRFLRQRYSLPEGSVTTVRYGISAPEQPSAPLPRGRLRVVVVGSLARQKGHDVLLEAARRSRRDWEVIIIGDGPQREHLQTLASSLPPGRVRFAGWSDDPGGLVAAADVLCMPSRWESLPYAVLEAGALSRAVVASRVDGIEEIVVHGETGLLVAPDRPFELAAALDHLAAAPQLVVSYGLAAHARVRALFTPLAMVNGVIAAYARACA